MSLQSVEQKAAELSAAEKALRREMADAVHAGVPLAAVARAAGVVRNTAKAWIEEAR